MKDNKEKNSVLIVDDEKTNIITLTDILSSEYTVYAAKNGEDAIKAAKQYLPDVILLDIIMPEMDGYEVLALLKQDDDTKNIPVFFVTGLGSTENEEKGLIAGAADYITKPFSPAIVKLRIKNHIQILEQIGMIKHLSITDQLTGIFNRRNFDYQLRFEWDRAKNNNTPLSILMIDIDNFKTYNDAFGHLQGDAALQTVASTIEKSLTRSSDFLARWGGEEFVVLLPNTDLQGALKVAENIRKNVENVQIPCTITEANKVTVSIGVNTITPAQNHSVSKFISHADDALYAAKKAGKNRVCKYEVS